MDRQSQTRTPMHPVAAALVACAVIAVLFTAGFLAQHYGAKPQAVAAPATTPVTPAPSPMPGVGDAVRDGKLEFTVSRVNCSKSTVGVEHLTRTAKGRFCIVSLSVRNITADEPQYFLGHAQNVLDTDGTGYGYDELASLYADQNTKTFVHKLGPGDRIKLRLVFDIPATATVAAIELHDSLLSGGAEITVR